MKPGEEHIKSFQQLSPICGVCTSATLTMKGIFGVHASWACLNCGAAALQSLIDLYPQVPEEVEGWITGPAESEGPESWRERI